jgi:hypothetical protein
MIIRALKAEDIEEVDRLYRSFYENDFYLPSLSNTITHAVVEDGEKILGFGEVKVFAEAIMVLDKNKNDRTKAITMKALMTKAIEDCKKIGIEQLHVSVKDDKFIEILEKHYEFEKVKGIILARKI